MTSRLTLLLLVFFLSCATKGDKERKVVNKEKNIAAENFSTTFREPGYTLFSDNCASCHNPYKEFETAPALLPRFKLRSNEWIHKFLTSRKSIQTDTSYQRLKKQYEYHCMEFPNLTREDVRTLSNYLNDYVKE